MLSRREAEPGREVTAAPEALHRRCEGLQCQRGDRSDSRDRHQPRRLFALPRARPELPVESFDLLIELIDPPEQQPAQLDDRLRQDFVPDDGDAPAEDWYRHIVDTQIAPLLREYWFDSPEDVEKAVAGLTADA